MIDEKISAVIARAASAALLRIGKTYQEQGLLHQAVSPYLKVVAYYPESEAAPGAVDDLLTIARFFEEHEQRRVAMAVYDRLERAARFRRWDGHAVTADEDIL
jgi:TolA-binding protein